MKHTVFGSLVLAGILSCAAVASPDEAETRFGENRAITAGDHGLLFTASLLPVTAEGDLVAEGDVQGQTRRLLADLEHILRLNASLGQVLRLHVYVANEEDAEPVRAVLAEAFAGLREPALTLVQSAMPLPGVLVMLDAVAEASPEPEAQAPEGHALILKLHQDSCIYFFTGGGTSAGHLLPGPVVFISGRAASGATLAEAVHGTMLELQEDLASLDLNIRHHTASLKVFLNQMDAAEEAARAIAAFYAEERLDGQEDAVLLPAVSFAEWRQDRAEVPVEIELVATGLGAGKAETSLLHSAAGIARIVTGQRRIEATRQPRVAYFDTNPRFSRIARVNSGRLVFVSGVYGEEGTAEEQVRSHFSRMEGLLAPHGSGLGDLVKATYYVAEPEIGAQLGEQRPHLYPEGRAPAASLVTVESVARPGRTLVTDMIAVAPQQGVANE